VARLAKALQAAGWKIEPAAWCDLLAQRGSSRIVVELKSVAGHASAAEIRARLADALLVARARAARLGAESVPVIAVPVLSDRGIADLERYIAEVAPGQAWAAVDARGRWHIAGDLLADVVPESLAESASDSADLASARSEHVNPFSDLGQWLIKVLLAPRLPRLKLLGPERVPAIRGILDLAQRANVAPSKASAQVAALEALGHLERSRRELRLVRVAELLSSWRHAANARIHEVPARFALPAADVQKRLDKVLGDHARSGEPPRVCLALFAAAAKHDAPFVRGAPVHVYAAPHADADLQRLRLVPCDEPSADLRIRVPRFPESVFRGSRAIGGVLVADLLQCWLDLAGHPARGEEQASKIASHLDLADLE